MITLGSSRVLGIPEGLKGCRGYLRVLKDVEDTRGSSRMTEIPEGLQGCQGTRGSSKVSGIAKGI